MEDSLERIESKQERSNKNSVNVLPELEIPELDEIIENHISWGEIDPIILKYYPEFARIRKVSLLVDYIEAEFGCRPSKNTLGKRYERMCEL